MDLQIINEYKTGISAQKLAAKYGKTIAQIFYILIKNNIPRRTLSDSHIVKKCNYSFFSKINSEKKAYWLGFLYADGAITHNSMKLTLHPKDKNHVLQFKKDLQSEHQIINDRGYIRLGITNQQIYNDLCYHGCFERKTFNIRFPSNAIVPKNLIHHFMRGYFDGDGCITFHFRPKNHYLHWKFELVSNKQFLDVYQSHLFKKCKIDRDITLRRETRRKTPIFYFEVGGHRTKDLQSIYNYLYKDAYTFLSRKKEKFETILNNF